MKLWLDDEREAPSGWAHARTVQVALFKLLEWHRVNGGISEMSLDHDLGTGQPTGYDLLYCMARLHLTVPTITVHSMNPEGKAQMEAFIERMELQQPLDAPG